MTRPIAHDGPRLHLARQPELHAVKQDRTVKTDKLPEHINGTGHGPKWQPVPNQERALKGFETTTLASTGDVSITRQRDNNGSDTVVVSAGKGNDTINVSQNDDGSINVTVNGETTRITLAPDQKLEIRGGKGADNIQVAANVTTEVTVRGGHGNDTLMVHSDNARAWSGKGNDTVFATGANSQVRGGRGNDLALATGDNSRVNGGFGNDMLGATGEGSNVYEGRKLKSAWVCVDGLSLSEPRVRRAPTGT